MQSKMVEGDACFSPTSNIADTKSRCKSSGQVNRLDQRPSDFFSFPFRLDFALRLFDDPELSEALSSFDDEVGADRFRKERTDDPDEGFLDNPLSFTVVDPRPRPSLDITVKAASGMGGTVMLDGS